jgi:hypothetical protein
MLGSTISKRENYIITFDTSLKILILTYLRPLTSSEFLKSADHLLEHAQEISKQFKSIGVIANAYKLGNTLPFEEIERIIARFLLAIIENGFRVASIVLPADIKDLYDRQRFRNLAVLNQSYNNIAAGVFNDIESALMFVITQLEEMETRN